MLSAAQLPKVQRPFRIENQVRCLPMINILIADDAGDLVRFAAMELKRYLERLFDRSTVISGSLDEAATHALIVGCCDDAPAFVAGVGKIHFLPLEDQAYLLRNTTLADRPALAIVGGSGAAALWGVYDLIERYGVQYCLHGDVLPVDAGAFSLPDIDTVFEPLLRLRCWPFHRDHAFGPGALRLAECKCFIDQLAKLRFNRIAFSAWPWEPFLDLQIDGIKRQTATLWFDHRYPVTDDMPGRHLFGDQTEFWHPDLPPRDAPYAELAAAGERYARGLFAHAHSRGMEVSFFGFLMEFAQEFRPLVPDSQTVYQLGDLTVGPGPNVLPDDPRLAKLSGAVIRAVIDTYPEADYYNFGVPEFRAWTKQAPGAWQKLDEKYGISQVMSLEDAVETARHRPGYSGTPERAVTEVEADVTALYFFDRLFSSPDVLPATKKPDARISIDFIAEELYPIIDRVLPKGAEMGAYIDYTSTHVLRRREVLGTVPKRRVASSLWLTLHDDNVGFMPQLATGSLHELVGDLREHGWAGFIARYWMISDHDPSIALLSKAAWDAAITPTRIFKDYIRGLCSETAVEPMLEAFRELESVTRSLEAFNSTIAFPEPGTMMKHWSADSFTTVLANDRQGYRLALAAVRRVGISDRPEGTAMINYWINRLEFGIGYLDTIEAVSKAATAERAADEAKEQGDAQRALEHSAHAIAQAQVAVCRARVATQTFARAAKISPMRRFSSDVVRISVTATSPHSRPRIR